MKLPQFRSKFAWFVLGLVTLAAVGAYVTEKMFDPLVFHVTDSLVTVTNTLKKVSTNDTTGAGLLVLESAVPVLQTNATLASLGGLPLTGGTLTGSLTVPALTSTNGVQTLGLTNTGVTVHTPSAIQTLSTNSTIAVDASTLRVVGNGSAVTLTNLPSIATNGIADGTVITVRGTSDSNTVTLQDYRTLTGTCLAMEVATITLKNGSEMRFQWSNGNQRWQEIAFSANSSQNHPFKAVTVSGALSANVTNLAGILESLYQYPFSLFAWYKASTNVFQDSAGTVVTVTNAAPVWIVRDLTRNAKTLTQATALNQPTFTTGTYPYMTFDGTNQYISAGTAADWSWMHSLYGPGFTIICCWQNNIYPPQHQSSILTTGAANNNVLGFDFFETTAYDIGLNISDGTNWVQNVATTHPGAIPGPNVTAISWSPGSNLNMFGQNEQMKTNIANTAELAQNGVAPVGALRLGSRANIADRLFQGRIYEAQIWQGVLGTNDIQTLCAQVATRANGDVVHPIDAVQYAAFPGICKDATGRLVAAWRSGTGHASTDGVIKIAYSSDSGVTWTTPVTALSGTNDLRGGSLCKLANNNLIMTFFENDVNTNTLVHGSFVSISSDNGNTWGAPIQILNDGFTNGWTAVQCPVVQMASGDLKLALYGASSGDSFDSTHVVTSTDNGLTWGTPVIAATGSANYTEPNLVVTGATSLGLLLRNTTSTKIDLTTSSDSGATWAAVTADVFAARGQPAVTKLASTKYLCVTRSDANGQREMMKYSSNLSTWNTAEVLYDATGDVGVFEYGVPIELSAGRIGVIWSTEYSSTNAIVKFTRFNEADIEAYP